MNYLSEPRARKPFKVSEQCHTPLRGKTAPCSTAQLRHQRPKAEAVLSCSFVNRTVEMTATVNNSDTSSPLAPCWALHRSSFFSPQVPHLHYPITQSRTLRQGGETGSGVKSIHLQLLRENPSLFTSTHTGWLQATCNTDILL